MADQTGTGAPGDPAGAGTDRQSIDALAAMFGVTMKKIADANDAQQVAILALTAVMALLPDTAKVEPAKLGVVLELLTHGRPDRDKVRQQVANYVSLIVGVARKLPAVIAEAERKSRDASGAEPGPGKAPN
jgi:hypothetical protein